MQNKAPSKAGALLCKASRTIAASTAPPFAGPTPCNPPGKRL